MIDVSDLITDPDFATNYTIIRREGQWINGRFKVSDPPTRLLYYGAVQPATTHDIEQLGIGDNEKSVMKFFCRQPKEIYITHNFNENFNESYTDVTGGICNTGNKVIQISDEIEFRGYIYKVLQISQWQHHGWIRAFASLKGHIA